MKHPYIHPSVEIVRMEAQSIICESPTEGLLIDGSDSAINARAPQRPILF